MLDVRINFAPAQQSRRLHPAEILFRKQSKLLILIVDADVFAQKHLFKPTLDQKVETQSQLNRYPSQTSFLPQKQKRPQAQPALGSVSK